MAHSPHLLPALPNELLVDMFSCLDCASLLVCKQVCKLFNGIITCTASLELIIELHAAGQETGCNPAIRPADQLDALKSREAAWDTLECSKEERVPMLNGALWELYGGVLAQCDGPDTLTFRRLPSIYRSIEETTWSIGGFSHPIRDFGMDPAQDLLVLVEGPRWSGPTPDHSYHFHLRTMSTGGPHPKAPHPPTISHSQAVQDPELSYTIQISAQHLGILFNSAEVGENELVVWEWTSGTIETALIGDEIRSFVFLSERHIITAILTPADSFEDFVPSLMILDFRTESNERHTLDEAEHVYFFRYPPLGTTANPIKFEIRSDPCPSWTPDPGLQVPFYIAKRNRIYVISLWLVVHNQLRSVVLLVPLGTFLSCMDGSSSHCTPTTIEWCDWGPRGTRMLMPRIPPSEVWVCYVYGSKYVALRKDKKRFSVNIYDLNQRAVSRSQKKTHDTEDEIYAIHPSIFEEGEIFPTGIETSLPYRLRTLPLDLRSIAQVAVVCSEDSLITVDSHRREFRILTF